MSFLSPKLPPRVTPAAPPVQASDLSPESSRPVSAMGSLITTGAQGLQRRPETRRTSLLGG